MTFIEKNLKFLESSPRKQHHSKHDRAAGALYTLDKVMQILSVSHRCHSHADILITVWGKAD